MTTFHEGSLDGTGLHLGVVVASWNQTVTDRLLDGARQRCDELGVEKVTVLRVSGALELPIGALSLINQSCDAVVAIGTVVKGDTDHYEIVVRESSAGVTAVSIKTGVPVTNAILAVHDFADAVARSDEGDSNKGVEAVDAAVLTITAIKKLEQR